MNALIKLTCVLLFLLFTCACKPCPPGENCTTIKYHKGWPVTIKNHGNCYFQNLVVADLDGDRLKELVVVRNGDDSRLMIFNSSGQLKTERKLPAAIFDTVPSVADINHDGYKEIVFPIQPSFILCTFDHLGNLINQWPLTNYCNEPVVIEDIDNDGNFEFIFTNWSGELSVLDKDGIMREGFPAVLENDQFRAATIPVVGNLDDDPDLEIVTISLVAENVINPTRIRAYKANGSLLWTQSIQSSEVNVPVMADINNDGQNEIAFTTNSGIFILDRAENFLLNKPMNLEHCSPIALADLDGDGDLELAFAGGNYVYAMHHDGSIIFSNYIEGINVPNAPFIADIDGNGILDIIMNGNRFNEKIYVWDAFGAPVQGFPLSVKFLGFYPTIMDFDDDHKLELITNSTWYNEYFNGTLEGTIILHAWDLESPATTENMPWPMYQHDIRHTGRFDSVDLDI